MTIAIQQAISGFKTVAVIAGPMTVRIHEALDMVYKGDASRYFLSLDFKFKEIVAMNIGNAGFSGYTKAEATRAATKLSSDIQAIYTAMQFAKDRVLNSDTFTNRYTVMLHEQSLDKIVSRYNAEFVQ